MQKFFSVIRNLFAIFYSKVYNKIRLSIKLIFHLLCHKFLSFLLRLAIYQPNITKTVLLFFDVFAKLSHNRLMDSVDVSDLLGAEL